MIRHTKKIHGAHKECRGFSIFFNYFSSAKYLMVRTIWLV